MSYFLAAIFICGHIFWLSKFSIVRSLQGATIAAPCITVKIIDYLTLANKSEILMPTSFLPPKPVPAFSFLKCSLIAA